MGQKTSKTGKADVTPEQLPSNLDINRYQRAIQKYEQKRCLNDENKSRRQREKDPRYGYRKPQTVDEISAQG